MKSPKTATKKIADMEMNFRVEKFYRELGVLYKYAKKLVEYNVMSKDDIALYDIVFDFILDALRANIDDKSNMARTVLRDAEYYQRKAVLVIVNAIDAITYQQIW